MQPQQPIQMPQVLTDTVNMQGGVDTMTPTLQLPTGMLRDALNFECSILGGYARIGGYERYDGHTAPSAVVYKTIFVGTLSSIPIAGDTVTGATSLATGFVLAVGLNWIVVSEVTGVFQIGELLNDGATLVGTTIVPNAALTALQQATYLNLAANQQRTHISAVPGSGPVQGVFVYNDVVYAFRANAGGTATLLYKESVSGWTQVPYLNYVYFTAGTTAPADGATLAQGGVTATVNRVMLQSGAWAGSAAGKLIITNPAGGNFAAGAATIGATTITLSDVQTAIAFSVGGVFQTVITNFTGQQINNRVYGCDGANKCWEFDGITLAPIDTGFSPDAPSTIAAHMRFLFVGIQSSLGFCAPGLPFNWTALAGAGEIAVGDTITNMVELPGSQATAAMGVWSRNTTSILYGTGASSWNLTPLNTGCGALFNTAQNMAHTYCMDDRGIIDMQTTLNYGSFDVDTITYRVNNFIELKRTRTVAASLNRLKSQYRLFFSDGYALYVTNLHGQYAWQNVASGAMPVLFPDPVSCVVDVKLSNGDETCYFGSTNGFVYQLEQGTSFDGAPISAYLKFGDNTVGNPKMLKRFRRCELQITAPSFFQAQFGYKLGYGSPLQIQPGTVTYQNNVIAVNWDGFTWDNFNFDGTSALPQYLDMNGQAVSYAISITCNSAVFAPFAINASLVSYSNRRLVR